MPHYLFRVVVITIKSCYWQVLRDSMLDRCTAHSEAIVVGIGEYSRLPGFATAPKGRATSESFQIEDDVYRGVRGWFLASRDEWWAEKQALPKHELTIVLEEIGRVSAGHAVRGI